MAFLLFSPYSLCITKEKETKQAGVTFAGAERRLQTCGGLTAQLFDSTSPATRERENKAKLFLLLLLLFFSFQKRLLLLCFGGVSLVFPRSNQKQHKRLFFFSKIFEKEKRVAKNKHVTNTNMITTTPPSTPASSELFEGEEDHLHHRNEEHDVQQQQQQQQQREFTRCSEEEEEQKQEEEEGVDLFSMKKNDTNKRAMTLQLKRASLFHALAKEADEKAKRDAEEALRKKRETQAHIRQTLDSQQEQKRLAREKEKMVERMLDTQQRRTAEKLDEERNRKEKEKRQLDQERAREAEFEMRKAREEKALRKKQEVERAAEFVRKAEEAQEMLDAKRAEEKKRRLMLVEAKMAQGDGEGIEKRRVEFLEMEEERFRLEARKKIEALEERERREKETRRLNDLKWRESLEVQVAEKEQRELDMAIGNMSLREMQFNGISA